jgi:hypothetical protein
MFALQAVASIILHTVSGDENVNLSLDALEMTEYLASAPELNSDRQAIKAFAILARLEHYVTHICREDRV